MSGRTRARLPNIVASMNRVISHDLHVFASQLPRSSAIGAGAIDAAHRISRCHVGPRNWLNIEINALRIMRYALRTNDAFELAVAWGFAYAFVMPANHDGNSFWKCANCYNKLEAST